MTFMHEIVLVVAIVFMGFASFFAVMALITKEMMLKRYAFLILFVALFFGGWQYGSGTRPVKVEMVEDLDIQVIKTSTGEMQIVSFRDDFGNIQVCNLQDKFNCYVDKDHKVQLTRFRSGPYCGVSWEGFMKKQELKLVKRDQ